MAKLISSLPIGAKVKFGKHQVNTEAKQDIIWQVGAQGHSGYPVGSTTLVTEKIIDYRALDGKEPSNPDANRKNYGNNRYKDSNIRQWLNKAGKPWFVKTHTADEPPTNPGTNNYGTDYDTRDGFLSAFTPEELAAIVNTSLTVAKNTVTDGGGVETVIDKVFLLSNTEVGLANEPGGAEGTKLPLFSNDASRICASTQQAFSNTKNTSKPSAVGTAWYWWLRSPGSSHSGRVRTVTPSGTLDYYNAYHGHSGVRPALNVGSGVMVSDTTDGDGCYTMIWNATPTISGSDSNLGDKSNNFDFKYQINDTDATDTLTLVEKIDGITKRTVSPAQRGFEYSLAVDVNSLSLGKHTILIEVTDNKGAKGVREHTFTKTNTPPTISGSDENLGDKNLGFRITYQVNDADGDELTVKERLNGDIIRTLSNPSKLTDLTIDLSDIQLRGLELNSSNQISIEATDPKGGVAFRTYTFKRVNTPPIINGEDESLGVISAPFVREYIVTDAEQDDVIVKEFLNDKELKTYQVTLGTSNTSVFERDEFIKLPNGSHEFRLEATDIAGSTSIRRFNFTKQETQIKLELKTPFKTDALVTKVFISPSWNILGAETAIVEVCNNAYDDVPTWEDITALVLQGKHFNLTNATKTAVDFGVNVRITITKKAEYVGEVSITGFGGAFE